MGDPRQMLRFGVPGLFTASCATLDRCNGMTRTIDLRDFQVFQQQVAARTGNSNEQDEEEPQRARHVPVVSKARERPVTRPINCQQKIIRIRGL